MGFMGLFDQLDQICHIEEVIVNRYDLDPVSRRVTLGGGVLDQAVTIYDPSLIRFQVVTESMIIDTACPVRSHFQK